MESFLRRRCERSEAIHLVGWLRERWIATAASRPRNEDHEIRALPSKGPRPRLTEVFWFFFFKKEPLALPTLREHFADFDGQGVQGEGFDDDVHAGGQEAGAGGGVFGVAGDE